MTTGDGFTAEFPLVRRGYDPVAVEGYLTELQTKWLLRVDQAEADAEILKKELDDAKQREEAIHLMMLAATRTKDEMLESAERELAEARAVAKEKAEQIVSEAQYEAFRIVTEARDDAEAALREAREDADALRTSAVGEGDVLDTQRLEERSRLRAQYTAEETELRMRIDHLRGVAEDLENRLRLLALGAVEELGSTKMAVRVENEAREEMAAMIQSAESVADEPVLDPDRPPMDETVAPETTDEDVAERTRGSFYSRRSAKLPRIGDDANAALAAVSAMRGSFRDPVDEEDVAMRSA